MIIYLNKNKEFFEITHSKDSDYQIIISRLKTDNMSINKKVNNSYKNISLTSQEAKNIKEFILDYFKNIIYQIDHQLIEK